MKRSENNITIVTQTGDAKGFVLIELLTAIAIIAILIGLLLPAIQKKREVTAAEEATLKVQQAGDAANLYRNRNGQYPESLAQLVQFVGSSPSTGISIDPRLASGRINGYLYEIVEADQNHCIIEAEPEFPGITGSQTVTALSSREGGEVIGERTASAVELENTLVTSFLTPGSDEAREEMFNQLRVKAAETVFKLIKQGFFFDIPAEIMARSFVDEASRSTGWIFTETVMDTNGDGRITIDEIRNFDDPNMESALKGPLAEFMDYTDDACMWGRLGEAASANIAVDAGEIELARGEQAPLLSYDGISILAITMIASDGQGAWLYGLMEAAEAAEASGDLRARDRAVKNFKKMVKAEIGKSITRSHANTLLGVLDTVTDETTGVPMLR